MLIKKTPIKLLRCLGGLYSKQNKNKLRDDPKHLIYYILLWIVYIDNYYKIY